MTRITAQQTDAFVLSELGRRLRETRLGRDMSQAQLAEEAGVGLATVKRIESGDGGQFASVLRLLRALGLVEGMDVAIPEPPKSPLQELAAQRNTRQRARPKTKAKPAPRPLWGDEA